MSRYIKSPMNYAGGKYNLLSIIIPVFPKSIRKFVDLFAGGFNVGINVDAETIYANDQITYLIDLYKMFRDTDTDELLQRIRQRIREYGLSETNQHGYIALREEYNTTRELLDLFILTCYSFNNQIRFNSKHDFNSSFGKNRSSFNRSIENNFITFCEALHQKNIVLSSGDFRAFDFSAIGSGDVVYCDPPYLLSAAVYNDGKRGFSGWSAADDQALMSLLDSLNSRGVTFVLSNVLSHKGKTNDALIEWSKRYTTIPVNKTYSSCNYQIKDRAAKTIEVIITNGHEG